MPNIPDGLKVNEGPAITLGRGVRNQERTGCTRSRDQGRATRLIGELGDVGLSPWCRFAISRTEQVSGRGFRETRNEISHGERAGDSQIIRLTIVDGRKLEVGECRRNSATGRTRWGMENQYHLPLIPATSAYETRALLSDPVTITVPLCPP